MWKKDPQAAYVYTIFLSRKERFPGFFLYFCIFREVSLEMLFFCKALYSGAREEEVVLDALLWMQLLLRAKIEIQTPF